MAEGRTWADLVVRLVKTGQPVPWGGRSVQLMGREDAHAWLAEELGINSFDADAMGAEVPRLGAYETLPPEARPELSAVSGPPEEAARRAQLTQAEPSILGMPVPGRTMYDLSDVTAGAVQGGLERAGRAVTQPFTDAAQRLRTEIPEAIERQHRGGFAGLPPEPEPPWKRLAEYGAPAITDAYRSAHRAVTGRPDEGVAPMAPIEEVPGQEERELEYVKNFIDTQPDRLPSGKFNEAKRVAMEEYEKIRPGMLSRAASSLGEGIGDVALGAMGAVLGPVADIAGAPRAVRRALPPPSLATSAIGSGAMNVAEVGTQVAGVAAGALGEVGSLAAEGLASLGETPGTFFDKRVARKMPLPSGQAWSSDYKREGTLFDYPQAVADYAEDKVAQHLEGETVEGRLDRHYERDLARGVPYALERQQEQLAELASSPAMAAVPYEQKAEIVGNGLREAWDTVDKTVAERMDRDFIDNARSDLSDIMSVVPMLGQMLFDVPEEEQAIMDPVERLSAIFSRSVKSGAMLTDSALAGLGYIVAHPYDSFNTMPIATLLTFADILAVLKPSARFRHRMDTDPKFADKMRKLIDVTDKHMPVIIDAINTAKRGSAAWSRLFGDMAANTNLSSQLFGDEILRGAPREGRGVASAFEEIGRIYGRDEKSSFKPSGTTFKQSFEEFDKTVDPATGKVEQPRELRRHEVEGETAEKVRERERPIGMKGGARVRTKRVERQALEGEIRTVRDGIVETLQRRSGTGRTPYTAADIDRAVSEAVSFVVPNAVMLSEAARNRALKDAVAWATSPTRADGSPKPRGSYLTDPKAIKAFAKQAKKEILGMASREAVPGVTGSLNVYNLRFKLGSESFSVIDDSMLSLTKHPTLAPLRREIRSEAITALANRASQRVEQGRYRLALVDALEDHAPAFINDTYTIRAGDTGSALVERFRGGIKNDAYEKRLLKANKGLDLNNLQAKAVINIPVPYRAKKTGQQWRFPGIGSVDAEVGRITRSLEENGALPAALRVDPEALASKLEENFAEKAGVAVEHLGNVEGPGGVPLKRVLAELRGTTAQVPALGEVRIRRGYKKIPEGANVARELGINTHRAASASRRVALPPVEIPGGVWVNPGTWDTLKFWARDLDARTSMSGFNETLRWMKANLTARNPKTHMNNIIANISMQAIRRGDPLTPAKVMQLGNEYRDFLQGKLKDPKRVEMFRAIERTGTLRTDMVVQELNALTAGSTKAKHGYAPHKTLERVYGWEDNLFKLEEGARNYRIISDALDLLDDGQPMGLTLRNGRRVYVTKKGAGWEVQAANRAGRPGKSYKLSESKLRDIIAQASMKPATDLFFDYSDLAGVARTIRSIPILAQFAAPFYSWYSKAMTVPFAQKGIVGHMFSSQPEMRTSNAKVLTRQIMDATAASARRSMLANSMRQEMIDNRDMITQLKSWNGRSRTASILRPVLGAINPLYYEFRNLEYMSPSEPADALLRLISNGIGTIHVPTLVDAVQYSDVDLKDGFFTMGDAARAAMDDDPWPKDDSDLDRLEKTNPRAAKRMRVIRNIWRRNPDLTLTPGWSSSKDMYELMGVSGGLLADIPAHMDRDDWSKMANTFASILVPGVYMSAGIAAGGLAWEAGLWEDPTAEGFVFGTRKHGPAELAPKSKGHAPYKDRTDAFQRWAVRRALGLGTDPVQIENAWGRDEQTGAETSVKGFLHKAYDRRIKAISRGVHDSIDPMESSAWRRYSNATEAEVKERAYDNWIDEIKRTERLLGSKAARTKFKFRRPNKGYVPFTRGRKPTQGLVNEEGFATLEWLEESLRVSSEKALKGRALPGEKADIEALIEEEE